MAVFKGGAAAADGGETAVETGGPGVGGLMCGDATVVVAVAAAAAAVVTGTAESSGREQDANALALTRVTPS